MKLSTTLSIVLLWASVGATVLEDGNMTTYGDRPTRYSLSFTPEVKTHSRRKRYIVFPKGSSLQLILELLTHVPTRLEVVVGPTLQVAWPLPSDGDHNLRSKRSLEGVRHHATYSHQFFRSVDRTTSSTGKKYQILRDIAALLDLFGMTVGLAWQLPDDPMIYEEFKKKHKIYKRNVFKKMETFMSRPGGANGRQCILKALCESGQRTPSKKDFLTEIFHRIFSVEAEEDEQENHEDRAYRKAHRSVNQNCNTLYPKCHFSFFNQPK